MAFRTEILGVAVVSHKIKRLGGINLKRAYQRAGSAVESQAKAIAPFRTGHLRRNIVSNATDTYAEIGVSLTVVPYAWYQEAGTSKMPANPYLVPALKACEKRIGEIFAEEIKESK